MALSSEGVAREVPHNEALVVEASKEQASKVAEVDSRISIMTTEVDAVVEGEDLAGETTTSHSGTEMPPSIFVRIGQ